MPWTPASSHKEESARFISLAQLCIDERKRLGYPDEDARSIVFNNVFGCAEGAVAMLNLLHQWTDAPGKHIIPQLLGLTATNQTNVNNVGSSVSGLAKFGFMFLAQAQIENGLRNLARGLGTVNPALGFYNLATAIVAATAVPADRRDVLRIPAEMRNSLHNNGIFHGKHGQDFVATIGGVAFEFRHDQRVQCASMSHIALAYSAAIEAFGEICRTTSVSNIAQPLMDHFSWDKLTAPA